jgi:serine/threonine-protein kinase
MKSQTEMVPAPPRSINPRIPAKVEQLIMRSIQKDPDQRFQTAGEFRDAVVALGYADGGVMKRITDPGARTAASIPIDSSPPTAAVPADTASAVVFKETRLAPPASGVPLAAPQVLKETRLGSSVSSESFAYKTEPDAAPSFFSTLTWVHYTIAGSAVGIISLGLIAIPLVIFTLSGPSSPAAAANNSNGNANKPSVATAATPEPTPDEVRPTPVPTATPEPIAVVPAPVATPTPRDVPVAQPPAEPKSTRKPTPRSTRRTTRTPNVECALTGKC